MNDSTPTPEPFVSLSERFAQSQQHVPAKSKLMLNRYAILYVALSVLIMAYSGLFGVLPILVFYALWLPQVFNKGWSILRPSKDMQAMLALPVLCCVSAVWSNHGDLSIYSGVEFISMICCTTIMSRVVPLRTFLKGLCLGISLVLLVTLFSGIYDRDYFGGAPALVGYFGSKNQVGLYAEIGMVTAFVMFFSHISRFDKLLFAIPPLGLSVICLVLSHSGASDVSLVLALFILGMSYAVTRFPGRLRKIVFGMAIFGAIVLILATFALGLQDLVLSGMGKDATLTGRTLLWAKGIGYGMEAPVVGIGYASFWVQGEPRAEALWYDFFVPTRMGFHFHNMFVETFVELGMVGVLVLCWLLWITLSRSFKAVLANGMDIENAFLLCVAVMFTVRSMVEVDYLGPFGIGPLLLYSVVPRLAIYRQQKK